MRGSRLMVPVAAALALLLMPNEARAEKDSCVDEYLLCINEASQESGFVWRTAKEAECGLDYYTCMRRKIITV